MDECFEKKIWSLKLASKRCINPVFPSLTVAELHTILYRTKVSKNSILRNHQRNWIFVPKIQFLKRDFWLKEAILNLAPKIQFMARKFNNQANPMFSNKLNFRTQKKTSFRTVCNLEGVNFFSTNPPKTLLPLFLPPRFFHCCSATS